MSQKGVLPEKRSITCKVTLVDQIFKQREKTVETAHENYHKMVDPIIQKYQKIRDESGDLDDVDFPYGTKALATGGDGVAADFATAEWSLQDALSLHPEAEIHNRLWVSPSGSDRGSGSEKKSLASISKALRKAGPGTVVMVRAGTYRENLDPSIRGTSADKPIILYSADGPGRAKIVAERRDAPVMFFHYDNHVGIHGFHLVGRSLPSRKHLKSLGYSNSEANDILPTGYRGGGDHAVVKSIDCKHVAIAANVIDGTADSDGIKMGRSEHVEIVANRFVGKWGENHIDSVSGSHISVRYNDLLGSSYLGPFRPKCGTWYVTFANNLVDVEPIYPNSHRNNQHGIGLGGVSGVSLASRPHPEWVKTADVRYATVRENVFKGKFALRTVALKGTCDSVFERNFFCNSAKPHSSVFWSGKSLFRKSGQNEAIRLGNWNITVKNNIICDGMTLGNAGKDPVIEDNEDGDLDDVSWQYGCEFKLNSKTATIPRPERPIVYFMLHLTHYGDGR